MVMRNAQRILARNVNGREDLREIHIDTRIILKCVVKKQDIKVCSGFT
jgi:hypothetical protein